jgi:diguanylate cyclase (GGDEF)-like protein/PAS domain S-box-containing protein
LNVTGAENITEKPVRSSGSLVEGFLLQRRWWLLPLLLWTLLVGWSLWTTSSSITDHSTQVARESARNLFQMIALTRLWNAKHGGVYAPVTEAVQPNPYLEIPDRDILTRDNRHLTLINPSYMTRQISELAQQRGLMFHITSLKPIRPANRPDAWETQALEQFENGVEEVSERMMHGGRDLFRYMAPLVTRKSCMKCHEKQGYEVGDIRGGISIGLSAEPIFGVNKPQLQRTVVQHLLSYLLLASLLFFFLNQTRRQWLRLRHIEELQQAEIERRTGQLLKANRQLLQSAKVFEGTSEGITITDAQGTILDVNKAFEVITGYAKDEVLGKNPRLLKSGRHDSDFYQAMWKSIEEKGGWRGEIWNRHKDGSIFPEWLNISAVRDREGVLTNYVAVFSDISSIKQSQERLDFLAHHDPLTGLPNRLLFNDRLEQAMKHAERNQTALAVVFLDLDKFKQINDTLGHAAGDSLLQQMARRLQELIRSNDTIARFSGDEFVALLEDVHDEASTILVVEKLLHTFSKPFILDGAEVQVTGSLGISLFPRDADDAAELLRLADAAMYAAKERGRNNYCLHSRLDSDRHLNR